MIIVIYIYILLGVLGKKLNPHDTLGYAPDIPGSHFQVLTIIASFVIIGVMKSIK